MEYEAMEEEAGGASAPPAGASKAKPGRKPGPRVGGKPAFYMLTFGVAPELVASGQVGQECGPSAVLYAADQAEAALRLLAYLDSCGWAQGVLAWKRRGSSWEQLKWV